VAQISAADNPALANSIIERALAGGDETPDLSTPPVSGPSDTLVELPGGYVHPGTSDLVREAEVRELTGGDEEVLAKFTSVGKALVALLARGVIRVGPYKADKDVLGELLAGDRDYLLLQIRIASFGPEVEYQAACGSCGSQDTYTVDLSTDVEVRRLEEPADRIVTVESKRGPITVMLPNGDAQEKLLLETNKTVPELNTILLAACIQSIGEKTMISAQTVRSLSIRDRDAVLKEIADRNPGPRMSDVKKPCSNCGEDITMSMPLSALFRL
jgi:hypothetical protein